MMKRGRVASPFVLSALKKRLFSAKGKRAQGSICAGEWNDRMGETHAAALSRRLSVP